MAQPPTNPAVPLVRSVTGDVNTGNNPPSESSVDNAENIAPSITTQTATGIGGIDLDPNRKRNTSFKITGILPSRPPSNSDDDDGDETTVTEDDVPDIAPIHTDSTGNTVSDITADTNKPKFGTIDTTTVKEPSNANPEQKSAPMYPQNVSESAKIATGLTNSTLPPNIGQRRNSQQAIGGGKGGGVGSGMLPSIRPAMALGYRFNIFVYDYKLGNFC